MNIRTATELDRDDVGDVHVTAFPEDQSVSRLALNLLSEDTTPATISLVAQVQGAVVGHVTFSPVTFDSSETLQGYILAPLGVKPDHQKGGIGSALVEHGMKELRGMGVNILFVYGDPKYYGRFGFTTDTADPYTAPYPLKYPFGWQAVALNQCDDHQSPGKIACVSSLCAPEFW